MAVLAAAILMHSLAFAQAGFSVGARAGVSLANQAYRFTPIDFRMSTDPLAGLDLAFLFETPEREHFNFRLDLEYAMKGSLTNVESVSVNHLEGDRIEENLGDRSVSRYQYLSVSPLARFRIEKDQKVLYLVFGPRLDMQLSYTTSSNYPLETQEPYILGMTSGAGAEWKMERISVFGEVLYEPDLSPVNAVEPLWVTNTAVILNAGIKFRLAP